MGVQAPRRLTHHRVRRAVALAKENYKSIIISFGITGNTKDYLPGMAARGAHHSPPRLWVTKITMSYTNGP